MVKNIHNCRSLTASVMYEDQSTIMYLLLCLLIYFLILDLMKVINVKKQAGTELLQAQS